MKYNGFYFWMFKSPMKKVLVEKYGREYAADIMKKNKKVYRELVEKADDIGDDNPMYVCSCDAAATNGTITRCQLRLMKPTSLFIMNLRRARQRSLLSSTVLRILCPPCVMCAQRRKGLRSRLLAAAGHTVRYESHRPILG